MSQIRRLPFISSLLWAYRALRRARLAAAYYNPRYKQIFRWVFESNEDSNFTYQLAPGNLLELCQCIAVVTGQPLEKLQGYLAEVVDNEELKAHVATRTKASAERSFADSEAEFGRRLGWYLVARASKPRVVVETGVDKGLGSLLLCYALAKNAAEGAPGEYFGTDINPRAGYLLEGPWASRGKILYGDSIDSLKKLDKSIDLFINDSDHSADYEYDEYLTVKGKLSARAIVLGDNSHVTDKLSRFARETGRHYLFFREVPHGHWYPGSGIGIAF